MSAHHPNPADAHSGAHAGAHGEGHGAHAHHVASAGLFLKVLLALLFLTFITVAASRFDFGSANLIVAMAIAAVKASLVMAIFMHLRWDTPMNQIVFFGSFLFLSLLFIFTLSDLITRDRDWAAPIKPPVNEQWVHPAKRTAG